MDQTQSNSSQCALPVYKVSTITYKKKSKFGGNIEVLHAANNDDGADDNADADLAFFFEKQTKYER